MTDPAALQKLLTWLSPAFPVGAFAWSSGLETAIAETRVNDVTSLQNWIVGALRHGGMRTDAIVLAEAWRIVGNERTTPSTAPSHRDNRGSADGEEASEGRDALTSLSDLCLALTSSAERARDLAQTGDAFVTATKAWPSDIRESLPAPCPYPVAIGAMSAANGVSLLDTLVAFLTAAVHSQVSVAVRLVPIGQSDGLAVVAALEPYVVALAKAAATASLEDIGGIAYSADIAQMRHEMLEPRIFRS